MTFRRQASILACILTCAACDHPAATMDAPATNELRARPGAAPVSLPPTKGGAPDPNIKPVSKTGIPDDSIKPVSKSGVPDDSIKPVAPLPRR